MIETLLKKHGEPVKARKHDRIFAQGDHNECLYYVVSGLLKAYYLSIDGKENIKSFIQAGKMIGSISSAYKKLPCTFSLIALEDSELLRIPSALLLKASKDSHAVAKEVIDFLLNLSMKKELREYQFLMLPAEQRYTDFVSQEPELVKQLTQNDVARYLGITPVALSRIKKRLSLQSPTAK